MINMEKKRIFVTVGTTKFDKLIATLSNPEILIKIQNLGYNFIQFQTGTRAYSEILHKNIEINYKDYFGNFQEEVMKSDLVISHAGAGTCLEVLKCGKPLIVVINEDLMDNHQIELAKHLYNKGYLYYCTCDSLKETLDKNFNILKKYPVENVKDFNNYLEKCMGFT